MTELEAITNLETALDWWLRAKAVVAAGQRSDSDRRDLSRRLMNLDEAILAADRFSSPAVDAAVIQAHQAMSGASA